jgi:hypothetical protein
VNIVGEAKSQNGQRPVNLIGSAQASEYAKRLIMEIVESDTNGGPPGPPVRAPPSQHYGGSADGARLSETIRVPIDAVGMIIGKGTHLFQSHNFHFPQQNKTNVTTEKVVKPLRKCKTRLVAESMSRANSIPMTKSVKSLSRATAKQ